MFEAATSKAVRSLEIGVHRLSIPEIASLSTEEVRKNLKIANDERLFVVAEGLRRGISIDEIHEITQIDYFFINKINNFIKMEIRLQGEEHNCELILAT